MDSFASTVLLLFLVTNPIGNLPLFITTLDSLPPERYRPVVIRESLFALITLAIFMVGGEQVLRLLKITQASLELAGGIILLMIAIKLVFGSAQSEADVPGAPARPPRKEPFIVPLAIPYIAGPAAISTCILVGGKGWEMLLISLTALLAAWLLGTLILLSGRWAGKILGVRALAALETLMGLLLTTMAVEMLIKGIKIAFLQA